MKIFPFQQKAYEGDFSVFHAGEWRYFENYNRLQKFFATCLATGKSNLCNTVTNP